MPSKTDALPTRDEMFEEISLANDLIWKKKINRPQIDEWLSNFTGQVHSVDDEHLIALWLLTNFVFYNEEEVRHLFKVAYQELIRELLISTASHQPANELRSTLHNTIFATLGKTGESSSMLMYPFRTVNGIGVENLHPISGGNYDRVVFVDDVTLSIGKSSQGWSYLQEGVKEHQGKDVHMLTMIASKQALEFLHSKGVSVTNAITLDEEDKAFHVKSSAFHFHPELRTMSQELAQHYGDQCYPSHPLGYKNGQYMFGFHYNIPDNTLPIFWSSENGWKPLMARSHKNYGKTGSDGLGIFI